MRSGRETASGALARRRAALLAAAALLAGCAPSPQPAPGDAPAAEPQGTGSVSEFGSSHHARIEGRVVDRRGSPLGGVEVVAWELRDRGRGSLAQHRAVSDAGGRFLLPVAVVLPAAVDSVTVDVVVRGYAGERAPATGEAVVAVPLVRVQEPPRAVSARLVMPLP